MTPSAQRAEALAGLLSERFPGRSDRYLLETETDAIWTKDPATLAVFREHLLGKIRMGVGVREDGSAPYLMHDLDGKKTASGGGGALAAALKVVTVLRDVGLAPLLEVSRSGSGFHVWTLTDPSHAPSLTEARVLGRLVLKAAGLPWDCDETKGHPGLFPHPQGPKRVGRAGFLPWAGLCNGSKTTARFVTDDGEPIEDQEAVLRGAQRVSKDQVLTATEQLRIGLGAMDQGPPAPEEPKAHQEEQHKDGPQDAGPYRLSDEPPTSGERHGALMREVMRLRSLLPREETTAIAFAFGRAWGMVPGREGEIEHLVQSAYIKPAVHVRTEFDLAAETPAEIRWKRASIAELVAAEAPPIPWLIEGFIASQECQIVTGKPKDGKTYVLLAMVLDAALGLSALGSLKIARPLRTLWIDEEMGLSKLQRRIKKLILGAGLCDEQVRALDEMIDLRPQQGFSLGSKGALDAFRKAVDEHKADLVILDSLTALQTGVETDNTDRRAFYNRVIAATKSDTGCAFVLLAHPPLPSKDAPAGSWRRPRGGGDSLAFTDRYSWLECIARERNAFGEVLKITLEEGNSREGSGMESQLIVLEDTAPGATVCRAEGSMGAEAASALGKANACGWEIIRYLDQHGGEAYQPEVKALLEEKGFGGEVYYSAIGHLERLKRLRMDPPRAGKSGKWLVLLEVP